MNGTFPFLSAQSILEGSSAPSSWLLAVSTHSSPFCTLMMVQKRSPGAINMCRTWCGLYRLWPSSHWWLSIAVCSVSAAVESKRSFGWDGCSPSRARDTNQVLYRTWGCHLLQPLLLCCFLRCALLPTLLSDGNFQNTVEGFWRGQDTRIPYIHGLLCF